jgi:BirA family transcriptional regulator, biotin operon repressor / biotin---[acetyl-CoA-carboxylase] ligase
MHGVAEQIWQAVAALEQPALVGFTVEVLPEIDSTNTELMRRARAGQLEPTLLVAQQQTAGRGRVGRTWLSAPGDSLTFSLGLALSPHDWQGLSLVAGVSVAESLHADVQIKWPNDLWWQGRKLAGILIETASVGAQRYAVIGVGINIRARTGDGLRTPPAWLQEALPDVDAAAALLRVALPLLRNALLFEEHGFAPFALRFAARDALRDLPVQLSGGETAQGSAHGVDGSGALLVHTSLGMQRITSAEVSVRPQP